ncbi:PorV/PorQ family protein [bacterium]|nr:MAG: PorV/PorQ family protein [bacterium]
MIRAVLAAVLLAAVPASAGFFPDAPFSDAAAGTTGAAFLRIPSGARGEAMGGANSATAEGAEALFWNPGGLGRLAGGGRSEATVGYNALLESSYAGALGYARPLADGRSVLAAGLVYHSAGEVEGYDRFANPNGSFSPTDLCFSGAYARHFEALSAGAALKLVRSEIAGSAGTTFALDLGVQADRVSAIGEGPVDLGASLRNLGPAIQVGGAADPLPFAIQMGARWHVSPQMAMLLDGFMPVDADPYPALGGEFTQPFGAASKGQLRFGYNVQRQRGIDGLTGLTGGGGLDLDRMRVDYAWVPFGELGTTHKLTLAFKF